MKRLLATITLSALLVGCQTGGGQRWTRTEVFFGLSKPGGGEVTPADWQTFVDEVVTPRFPSGLSVVSADGQWREASGKIAHEPSRVLILFHPPSAATEAAIDVIRKEYCTRFQQEAVMKVTSKARVAF